MSNWIDDHEVEAEIERLANGDSNDEEITGLHVLIDKLLTERQPRFARPPSLSDTFGQRRSLLGRFVYLIRHAAPAATAGTWSLAPDWDTALHGLAVGDRVYELPVKRLEEIATNVYEQSRSIGR